MPRKTPHATAEDSVTTALLAFGAILAALWLLHLPLLRLPYFWDEAGYFIPAARDVFLTGDLIPYTTLSNAHPPLVMIWLALCWKLTAYSPMVTRTAMLLVASFGLTALWLLGRRVASVPVATASVVLTAAIAHGVFAVGDGTPRYRRVRPGAVDAVFAHPAAALAGGGLRGPGSAGERDHGGGDADFGGSGLAGVVRVPLAARVGRAVVLAAVHTGAHGGDQRSVSVGAAAADGLVCVSFPPYWARLWQSRLPALQRGSYDHAAAHSGRRADSAVARDRVHEPVRADGKRGVCAVGRAPVRGRCAGRCRV